MFSTSATKLASKASENAIKYGGMATQKVADISVSVGDKVTFYFCRILFFILINFSCLTVEFLLTLTLSVCKFV